ncbi:MAG: hypothetical protein QOI92_1201, partial [Chloroflexota bacterium]|nr:hypothetical protein [Chloroflexota bacterium]
PATSSAPSAAPTDDTGNAGATGDIPSDAPGDSVSPASPVLENHIPTSINGVTLSIQSAVDATSLSSGPDGRALDAAVMALGKQGSDLEVAVADDQTTSIDLTIIGFRVDGIAAAEIRKAVLEAWLAAGTSGVTTSTIAMSGTPVTKVSYGDGGADEYVLTIGDSVFVLETTDASLAQSAAAALITPNSSPSAQASLGS